MLKGEYMKYIKIDFRGARENNSMFELWHNNSDKLGSVSRSANKLIQIKWFKKILPQGLLYYLE